MEPNNIINFTKQVLNNMPTGWLGITTHRLDIYNEELAKTDFLTQFTALYHTNNSEKKSLESLPTAYDYIRLGHPLSCVLEWTIAHLNDVPPAYVISFESVTAPIMAVLRTNLLGNKKTRIVYKDALPELLNEKLLREVYGYIFDLQQVKDLDSLKPYDGSTVYVSYTENISAFSNSAAARNIDFYVNIHQYLGSVLLIPDAKNENYIAPIQHVRRRETVAMTPINTLAALEFIANRQLIPFRATNLGKHKSLVLELVNRITNTTGQPLVGSSGLSIQYAIMMGLIHHAQLNHQGKVIKFIVPPNCYGGTNDQARRVAACLKNVSIVDLPVDGDNDMVRSIDRVLEQLASENAIPYIIAEIPTNPRVEVPDLDDLKTVLTKERKTPTGQLAAAPVFILDQTFCPNVQFIGDTNILEEVQSIAYASGSKFPSGGKCTAGYCVANKKAAHFMNAIETHLTLCDNEATPLQYEFLAEQLPSMLQRIQDAYINTRDFVHYIQTKLPTAKINFVSDELAAAGFTPSVFSLDLPTYGNTAAEKEENKRALNLKLIHLMISKIPHQSKFCVSYGQLTGCYWTIPATSTQGTTKEGDKDYIVRASLSPELNLNLHKQVFKEFVESCYKGI